MNSERATALEGMADALDLIEHGIAYFDADLCLARWNASFADLGPGSNVALVAGLPFIEMLDHTLAAGRYPEAVGAEKDWRTQVEAWLGEPRCVAEYLIDDGRWVRCTQHRTPDGGTICVCTDVSDLKRGEREVRESRDLMTAVVDFIPAQLTVKDENQRYIFVNKAVSDVTKIPREKMIGHTATEVYGPKIAGFLAELDDQAIAHAGEIIESTDILMLPAFGERHVRSLKRSGSTVDGRRYIMSITEDVTERVMADAALKVAMREAKSANQAKSTFLATMSHEIRTPLNGVLGMAQVMAFDTLSPAQRDRLNVIRKSGEALLAILNDVLDLSKIEAGKLSLEEIEFDLGETVQGVVHGYEYLAKEKGLAIHLDMGAAGGVYRGDPTRLRQILQNLISNALKFTEEGSVAVAVDYVDQVLCLRVTDTGIGIPADKVGQLFSKFSQVDESTSRKFGGTGLGLSICRELAHLMGGAIEVESLEDRGSCFTLTLPFVRLGPARIAVESEIDDPDMHARPMSVLAAEDNATNQMVLRALLQVAGAEVTLVGNGVEVIEAWSSRPWDVILMDVQMPLMDGLDATREIRRREAAEGRPRTPIIALTANTMAHQVAEYGALGMDGHVAKPIEAKALFEALAEINSRAESPLAAAS